MNTTHREAIHLAAAMGKSVSVAALLDLGAYVNAVNSKQETAVMLAARCGHVDTVRLLLDYGCDITYRDEEGFDVLQQVVHQDQLEMVKLLLERGASSHVDGGLFSERALALAALFASTEIVSLIIANGAAVDHADSIGDTALMGAAFRGDVDIIRMLVSAFDTLMLILHHQRDGDAP